MPFFAAYTVYQSNPQTPKNADWAWTSYTRAIRKKYRYESNICVLYNCYFPFMACVSPWLHVFVLSLRRCHAVSVFWYLMSAHSDQFWKGLSVCNNHLWLISRIYLAFSHPVGRYGRLRTLYTLELNRTRLISRQFPRRRVELKWPSRAINIERIGIELVRLVPL